MTDTRTDTKQGEQGTTIYQLRVSIAGARPPIWRRVLVPARSTLAELHLVIRALMGWYDDHLHQFEAPGLVPLQGRIVRLRNGPFTQHF